MDITINDKDKPHLVSINLSLYDIIHDQMNGEMRQYLIESISCADEVIGHVASQLVDGYTDNGFSGRWSSNRNTALQKAREQIAKNSDYAVKRTIEDMQIQIDTLTKDVEYWRNKRNDFQY